MRLMFMDLKKVKDQIRHFIFGDQMYVDLSDAESCGIREFLLRVDNKTLIKKCILVCKQWKEILDQKGFWIEKCEYEGHPLPAKSLAPFSLDYKRLAVHRPFDRNLIEDQWDDSFRMDKRWKISTNGSGRGFKVERPPVFFLGSFVEGFDENLVKGCVSTSFFWSTKTIAINLVESGIDPRIMDELRPTVSFSELVANRSDCASTYEMSCWLSPTQTVNSPTQVFESGEYYHSDTSEKYDDHCYFNKEVRFEQWQAQNWVKVEDKFTNYPPGMRFVILQTKGKDLQYWAGNYGTKMAHCSVIVRSEFNPVKTKP